MYYLWKHKIPSEDFFIFTCNWNQRWLKVYLTYKYIHSNLGGRTKKKKQYLFHQATFKRGLFFIGRGQKCLWRSVSGLLMFFFLFLIYVKYKCISAWWLRKLWWCLFVFFFFFFSNDSLVHPCLITSWINVQCPVPFIREKIQIDWERIEEWNIIMCPKVHQNGYLLSVCLYFNGMCEYWLSTECYASNWNISHFVQKCEIFQNIPLTVRFLQPGHPAVTE